MQIDIPLRDGLSLRMSDAPAMPGSFPTSILQRGLLLLDGEQDLAEEAVGFGVPIVKRGLQTVFPGAATVDFDRHESIWSVRSTFRLNRIERLARRSAHPIDSPLLNSMKDVLATAMRRVPASGGVLTGASSMLRRMFRWETTYVLVEVEIEMAVAYTVDVRAGMIMVELDGQGTKRDVTEVILMHEQGARAFDRYRDSTGQVLIGSRIGFWEPVRAPQARFESSTHKLQFGLPAVPGARLFRGRELVGTRLAWAGFGYSLPSDFGTFKHELLVARQA